MSGSYMMLTDHAQSIKRQLKSLRRETEYARKLILNEKKIDHLLGVLDRSKDSIMQKSIDTMGTMSTMHPSIPSLTRQPLVVLNTNQTLEARARSSSPLILMSNPPANVIQPDFIKRRGSEFARILSPSAGALHGHHNKENLEDAYDGRQTSQSLLGFSSSLGRVKHFGKNDLRSIQYQEATENTMALSHREMTMKNQEFHGIHPRHHAESVAPVY